MTVKTISDIFSEISRLMDENKDYLVELDSQNGDGDLGLSMSDGFNAAYNFLKTTEIEDLGMAMNKTANVFNEAAPSTLGTIVSFSMKGIARALKGKKEAGLHEAAEALLKGVENISEKAGSKPGEKTILDSLYPGAKALFDYNGTDIPEAALLARDAAAEGSENTRGMKAVWGRAAYFGEKSIGILDGGSVAGKLIFEGIYNWACKK